MDYVTLGLVKGPEPPDLNNLDYALAEELHLTNDRAIFKLQDSVYTFDRLGRENEGTFEDQINLSII